MYDFLLCGNFLLVMTSRLLFRKDRPLAHVLTVFDHLGYMVWAGGGLGHPLSIPLCGDCEEPSSSSDDQPLEKYLKIYIYLCLEFLSILRQSKGLWDEWEVEGDQLWLEGEAS